MSHVPGFLHFRDYQSFRFLSASALALVSATLISNRARPRFSDAMHIGRIVEPASRHRLNRLSNASLVPLFFGSSISLSTSILVLDNWY
jgi:hypothetical protein